jgi:DNA-binding PadR family transcriptional regulator
MHFCFPAISREKQKMVAWKESQGTKLKVFSGKEARLNRVILKIMEKNSPLINYDVWCQIKSIKGFRHVDSKTAYRRMEALREEDLLAEKGTRPGKRGGDRVLYELTLRGRAVLKLAEKNLEKFIKTATNEQLTKFIDLFS